MTKSTASAVTRTRTAFVALYDTTGRTFLRYVCAACRYMPVELDCPLRQNCWNLRGKAQQELDVYGYELNQGEKPYEQHA